MTDVYYACECPTAHIKLVQQHTEFDFAIAHYVLEDTEYAKVYRNRPPTRILILDNGKFELTHPLSPEEVLEAAQRVKADYIVPPDHFGDFERTKISLKDFIKRVKGKLPYRLAPVIVGKDPGELARCYDYYTTIPEIDMYCISFLTDRVSTLRIVRKIDKTKSHHLLGFSTRKEFKLCLDLLQLPAVGHDTSKPVSATYANEAIRDLGRGSYIRPGLDAKLNEELLVKNITTFKGWLNE